MRLFFAIELPSDVRSQLGRLKPKDESRDYRWVDPSLMHVTLAFLGEQPSERLTLLEEIGAAAAQGSRSGMLRLGGVSQFGSRRAPRVLLVNLDGELEALTTLQARLSGSLRDAGFLLEEREFRPHIALARRRESAHDGPPVDWPPALKRTEFAMDKLTLFQSRLSPRGPTYVPLAEFPIGG